MKKLIIAIFAIVALASCEKSEMEPKTDLKRQNGTINYDRLELTKVRVR